MRRMGQGVDLGEMGEGWDREKLGEEQNGAGVEGKRTVVIGTSLEREGIQK